MEITKQFVDIFKMHTSVFCLLGLEHPQKEFVQIKLTKSTNVST